MQHIHMEILQIDHFYISTFKGESTNIGCFVDLHSLTQKWDVQPFLTWEALSINHDPTPLFPFPFWWDHLEQYCYPTVSLSIILTCPLEALG